MGAIYRDKTWAKLQNRTIGLFGEIAVSIYVLILLYRNLRFSIFGQNTNFGHPEMVSERSGEKGILSFGTQL